VSLLADSLVDWGALAQVAYISAIAGVTVAAVLGLGITSALRAREERSGAGALALNAVTVLCVLVVGAAVAIGVVYMVDKG
jgi:hypothetical protein